MAELKPEVLAEKIVKGEPLTSEETAFYRSRLESMLKRAAVAKHAELKRIVKEKRYRELKTPLEEPSVYERTRFERGMMVCIQRPFKVHLFEKQTGKKVHETVQVERQCPTFPESDVACYESTVTAKRLMEAEEPSTCEKAKAALACAGSMSPTVASGFTEEPKQDVHACLEGWLRVEDYTKRKSMAEVPPPRLEKERKEVLRKEFLLDEPIYHMPPTKREELLKAYEKLKEKVPV